MPILKLTWCQAAAFTLPDLPSDRWQRVQMFKRKPIPLTIIRFLCTLGRKSRFVRRFEKLTLLPKVLAFPHTSHFPATGMLPSKIHCRAATRESLEPEHVQDSVNTDFRRPRVMPDVKAAPPARRRPHQGNILSHRPDLTPISTALPRMTGFLTRHRQQHFLTATVPGGIHCK